MKLTNYIKIIVLFFTTIILTACSTDLTKKVSQITNTIEVGEEFEINKMFQCENGISIEKDKSSSLDTSKIGNYNVNFIISSEEKTQEEEYTINVVDTQAPVINADDSFAYVNTYFNPEKDVIITDNSGELIKPAIILNNVDIKTIGNYPVVYEAIDSSGNKSQKEINVNIKDFEEEEQLCEYANNIINQNNYKNLNCELYTTGNILEIGGLRFYKNLDNNTSIVFKVSMNSCSSPVATTTIENYLTDTNTYVLSKKNFFIRIMAYIEKTNVTLNATNWYHAKSITITSKNGSYKSKSLVMPDWERSNRKGTLQSPKYDMTSILGFNLNNIKKFNKIIEGNNLSIKLNLYEGLNGKKKEITLKTKFSDKDLKLLSEIVDFSKHFLN